MWLQWANCLQYTWENNQSTEHFTLTKKLCTPHLTGPFQILDWFQISRFILSLYWKLLTAYRSFHWLLSAFKYSGSFHWLWGTFKYSGSFHWHLGAFKYSGSFQWLLGVFKYSGSFHWLLCAFKYSGSFHWHLGVSNILEAFIGF